MGLKVHLQIWADEIADHDEYTLRVQLVKIKDGTVSNCRFISIPGLFSIEDALAKGRKAVERLEAKYVEVNGIPPFDITIRQPKIIEHSNRKA